MGAPAETGGGRRSGFGEEQSVDRSRPEWRSRGGILGDDEAGALDPGENSESGEEGEGLARRETQRTRRGLDRLRTRRAETRRDGDESLGIPRRLGCGPRCGLREDR